MGLSQKGNICAFQMKETGGTVCQKVKGSYVMIYYKSMETKSMETKSMETKTWGLILNN